MTQPLREGLTDSPVPSASIAGMPVRLPEFWPSDPAVWFVQGEAQFASHRITSQETKFNSVAVALPPAIAMEVRDILLHRPQDEPYTKPKEEIIKRTTASARRRLQQLLTTEDLGDQKPAQLLRRMQHLLGDKSSTIDQTLLREHILQRLPNPVRMILASAGDVSLQNHNLVFLKYFMNVGTREIRIILNLVLSTDVHKRARGCQSFLVDCFESPIRILQSAYALLGCR